MVSWVSFMSPGLTGLIRLAMSLVNPMSYDVRLAYDITIMYCEPI